ncbi:MAG: alpha/beta hydrolase [Caulobacter sp.]|nr:alpha/beta hydrolase [Caulobacter sp.]
MPAPVIMVHGAFCGGWVFENFRTPFEAAGHDVLAPDLPGRGSGASAANRSMTEYAENIAGLCRDAAEPPILVGHSIGGLVAQMAAARAPVSALILLAPSPPWGVSGVSMEEAVSAVSLYALGPFWLQAIDPDASLAKAYSLDRMAAAERDAAVARMVPESGLALWQTLNWWLDPFMTTQVQGGKVSAPALVLAGARDVIHPPATVKQTADRLDGRFEVLPDMSHWLPGEPGWDAVAARCLNWLGEDRRAAA